MSSRRVGILGHPAVLYGGLFVCGCVSAFILGRSTAPGAGQVSPTFIGRTGIPILPEGVQYSGQPSPGAVGDSEKRLSSSSYEDAAFALSRELDKRLVDPPSFWDFEDKINMFFAVAVHGEAGAQYLADIFPTLTDESEQDLVWSMLAYFPSKVSLRYLLEGDSRGNLPDAEDLKKQLEVLPTSTVEEYLPQIRGFLKEKEARDMGLPDLLLAAEMAFRHRDGEVQSILGNLTASLDTGMLQQLVPRLLFVEAGGTVDFLEGIATSSSDPEVRRLAGETGENLMEVLAR